MYKTQAPTRTKINVNNSVEGETMEMKIRRIMLNKEPIKDGAPLLYTERKDGVLPETNVRTDRFEIAIDAMDKATKTRYAKRTERHATKDEKTGTDGGAESAQATPEA